MSDEHLTNCLSNLNFILLRKCLPRLFNNLFRALKCECVENERNNLVFETDFLENIAKCDLNILKNVLTVWVVVLTVRVNRFAFCNFDVNMCHREVNNRHFELHIWPVFETSWIVESTFSDVDLTVGDVHLTEGLVDLNIGLVDEKIDSLLEYNTHCEQNISIVDLTVGLVHVTLWTDDLNVTPADVNIDFEKKIVGFTEKNFRTHLLKEANFWQPDLSEDLKKGADDLTPEIGVGTLLL